MTPDTLEGTPIELDAEGFFQRPEQWTREMAGDIAADNGIAELTDRHWQVIDYMRATYLETGIGTDDPHAREGLRRPDQGALPALPQGAGQARREDRGHPQAPRLHLRRRPCPRSSTSRSPRRPSSPRRSRRSRSSISKGSLEGIYPGLIMANGARMEGIEANVFFTFFGLDAIRKDRQARIKVATVGNPGMHIPTLLGALPGMSALATRMMQRQMEKLDIPPIGEFVEMISDSGAGLYACKASVDMFKLTEQDFIEQVDERAHGRRVLRARRRWRDHLHLRRPPRRARRSRRSSATGSPFRVSTTSRGPI